MRDSGVMIIKLKKKKISVFFKASFTTDAEEANSLNSR